MASIEKELEAILKAIYGEDVRGSIHDAIEKINDVTEEFTEEISQRQTDFEDQITTEQTSYENNLTQEFTEYKAGVDASVETALTTSAEAKNYAHDAQDSATAKASEASGYAQDALDYKHDIQQMAADITNGLTPMGGATIATLPSNAQAGWMYYLTENGVTDSRFDEGAGLLVLKNEKVYYTGRNTWTIMRDSSVGLSVENGALCVTYVVGGGD